MKKYFFFLLIAAIVFTAGCSAEEVEYRGETKDGLPHGWGTWVHPNGATYVGEFSEGLREGKGTWKHQDGYTYSGTWQNDLYHGSGILTIPGVLLYEGEWAEGLREGYGVQKWQDNTRYEGYWKEDRRHGQGTISYSDGSYYEGQWEDGERSGEGTLVTAENQVFSGEWYNDQYVYIPVKNVLLNSDNLTLTLSSYYFTLEAIIFPVDATNQEILWVSSDPAVVTVEEGIVTPLSTGSATITVTAVADEISAECQVTVIAAPVTVSGLTINQKYLLLRAGSQPQNLEAIITPEDATNQNVFWNTDNPEVATVGPTGRVTALKPGEATITAQSEDGGFNDTATIIVLPPLE